MKRFFPFLFSHIFVFSWMSFCKSLGLLLLFFSSYKYFNFSVISKFYKILKILFLTILVLGTDRVEQMTKTYNDIDMVTHLLAEVGIYNFFLQYKELKLERLFGIYQIFTSNEKLWYLRSQLFSIRLLQLKQLAFQSRVVLEVYCYEIIEGLVNWGGGGAVCLLVCLLL